MKYEDIVKYIVISCNMLSILPYFAIHSEPLCVTYASFGGSGSHMVKYFLTTYLLVIGAPYTAGDGTAVQVKHGGPVSLTCHRAHEDEAIAVTDESHPTIVGPREVRHLKNKDI